MRARTLSVGALLPLALACGGRAEENTQPNFDVPSTLFRSGTRLKARVLRADAAQPSLLAIVDSEEGRECAFRRASDGELRCLPSPELFTKAFADASCEEPVVGSTALSAIISCSNKPLTAAVSRMREQNCEAEPVPVFELEPMDAASKIYQLVAGQCEELWRSDLQLYRLGREVEPTRFVRAELVDVPLAERLTRRELHAEDGSSWTSGLYDERMKTSCVPNDYLPGAFPGTDEAPLACRPEPQSGIAWVSLAADCSTDDGFVSVLEQACYDFGQAPSEYMLTKDAGWARVSPEPLSEQLFVFSSIECEPFREGVCFASTEPVDDAAWLPLERTRLGTGRIRLDAFSYDGQPVAYKHTFFDSEEEGPCQVYSTSDGMRCIAHAIEDLGNLASLAGVEPRRYYTSSAKEERLASSALLPPPSFLLVASKDGRECGELSGPRAMEAAYPIGKKYTGPVFDEKGEPVDLERVEGSFYRLGPAVPWTKFPELRNSVE